MKARLERITVYPIKSLDGQEVHASVMTAGGALLHDREFAIFDEDSHFINGKNNDKVHALRAGYDFERGLSALGVQGSGQAAVFQLETERAKLEAWLKAYFGQPLAVRRNTEQGFPDDLESPGPTLVSTASLEAVAGWYGGMDLDELRRRFRANLEISGVPAFWEDRLVGESGTSVPFQIGSIRFEGLKACARCVVPTRRPDDGKVFPDFAKRFAVQRAKSLPQWAERSRFDHAYRFTVNTRVPESEAGKTLAVGDAVSMVLRHSN